MTNKSKKVLYKEVYTEVLNGRIIHYESSQVKYGTVNKEDGYIIESDITDDYNLFVAMVKSGEVKSIEFKVVNRFGKDILKQYSWYESWRYLEKYFKEYQAKKYIEYCNNLTFKSLINELSANDFIEWCKDNDAINLVPLLADKK